MGRKVEGERICTSNTGQGRNWNAVGNSRSDELWKVTTVTNPTVVSHQKATIRPKIKVVRSHSLGEFWKSALHKSMSAKAPGAGESGERMDNDGAKQ